MAQKNNRIVVPEAKAAMEQFKMQAASEVGVNLNQGYNGDITARQAGSVGGQMVKKMMTIRITNTLHEACYTRKDRTAFGHAAEVRYIAEIVG